MNTLRQAALQLVRRSRHTIACVALLALGVAFATSFYSVLSSALLTGLPFPDGDRLVALSTREAAGWPMPLQDFDVIAESQQSLEWILPLRTFNTMVTRQSGTLGVIGSYVPAELFERLDVTPQIGRAFTRDDEAPSSANVALISHRLWHGSYGADPAILGETVVINREPTTIVGVLPPGFRFPLRHDVWGVLRREGRDWSQSFVFGFAKLGSGVTIEGARDDLDRIVQLLDEARPEAQKRNAALDLFVRTNIGDRAGQALKAMVWAALGLVLLACANLANLRLGETLRRQTELSTRLALGAGRWGLVRLVLAENLLIGVASGALALGIAWILTAALGPALLSGHSLSRIFWVRAELDLQVTSWALVLAIGVALLGALAPIVTTLATLRGPAAGRGAAARPLWTRGLVGAQVGLCFALLVGAAFFSVRARELLHDGPRFSDNALSSVLLSSYQADADEPDEQRALQSLLQQRLDEHPSIHGVAFSSSAPWSHAPRHPVGRQPDVDRETALKPRFFEVSASFLETLELPLLSGRPFGPEDADRADAVALVSRSLAERLYDGDALGQRLFLGGRREGEPERQVQVVGVVEDLGIDRLDTEHRNLDLYVGGRGDVSGALLVRSRDPGGSMGSARTVVEEVLAATAPRVGTLDALTVADALRASTWVERRLGQVLTVFGIFALLLTLAGTYAVIGLMVRRREMELGIRAALGARPRDLGALVLGESGRQLSFGLLLGLMGLWASTRLVESTLFGDLEWRPSLLLAGAAIVSVVCVAASWVPTLRAARADPSRTLRDE